LPNVIRFRHTRIGSSEAYCTTYVAAPAHLDSLIPPPNTVAMADMGGQGVVGTSRQVRVVSLEQSSSELAPEQIDIAPKTTKMHPMVSCASFTF
jgi:hypothetical protein